MTSAGYVIGGWAFTGAAILAYWVRLVVRTRRAESPDADREQATT